VGAPAPSPLALRLGQTGFQNPARRLRLALYGHPDSGGYREKKFNSAIKNLDPNKFSRGVTRIKELKDVKNSLSLKEGELRDEED
jgi:hypothetical protein